MESVLLCFCFCFSFLASAAGRFVCLGDCEKCPSPFKSCLLSDKEKDRSNGVCGDHNIPTRNQL